MSRTMFGAFGAALVLLISGGFAASAHAQSYCSTCIDPSQLYGSPVQPAVYQTSSAAAPAATTQPVQLNQGFNNGTTASQMAGALLPPRVLGRDPASGRVVSMSGQQMYEHNLSLGMSPDAAQSDVLQAARYNATMCQQTYQNGLHRHKATTTVRRIAEGAGFIASFFVPGGGWVYPTIVGTGLVANEANSTAYDGDSKVWTGENGGWCMSMIDYYQQHNMWQADYGSVH